MPKRVTVTHESGSGRNWEKRFAYEPGVYDRKRLPFRILVLQTDNGAKFHSRFHWHAESLDIRHVYIRPASPHLNGKVERSHRIDEQEFYQMLDQDTPFRLQGN